MNRKLFAASIVAATTLLSGCGGGSTARSYLSEEPTFVSGGSTARSYLSEEPTFVSVVPWTDYASTLKSDLDRLATDKNCVELQSQFDIADQNNQATMDRTGHNNADLMGYIFTLQHGAGCY